MTKEKPKSTGSMRLQLQKKISHLRGQIRSGQEERQKKKGRKTKIWGLWWGTETSARSSRPTPPTALMKLIVPSVGANWDHTVNHITEMLQVKK